ncbi:phosphatidylinositol-binding clathrin assembly protein LAP isoform X1 [Hydra vulgaris]|uniref:Phosphatidylinositol-binding clathrin assembly protein n=1 Tax=Hydra vulgaris TaxID=6087 RepID=T2MD37_HYDVU|nr:phosphatidylinositol-binding clathrin assembly protein LAP [Hydra vulgaris]XP_047128070.1 phosphatidylinositol-binding clathrin assembly protein LAP [Hydra vulgaris]XP_047128071.1 phosphatidylinositol-binding clathrin assembly protein LAP [Hydra vulgaris]
MNVIDRVESAKHTLTGSGISKAVAKATSHEIIGPKKKHVDYIHNSLEYDNVSIPNVADMLFERCTNSSWVVVFKALVVFHNLMANANEKFIQYIASRSTTWMLQNFYDKGVQGYDMSHIIRRYSAYLSEKAISYRLAGFDFCRAPRGKKDGLLRNMDTVKLLKTLPIIRNQLDALLETSMSANDLTNGVSTAAFMLLFKDLIRSFACYNDGIINLLEKYFDMKKADCKAALEIYKRFLAKMEDVSLFLKVAEEAGIDKGEIPDLAKAPQSLLEAMTSHYQSLEKGKTVTTGKPITLASLNLETSEFVTSNSSKSLNDLDTADVYLEQERKMLEMFEKRKKEETKNMVPQQPATIASRFQSDQSQNPFSQPQQTMNNNTKPSDDLMLLSVNSSVYQQPRLPNPYMSNSNFNVGFNAFDLNSAFKNQQSTSQPNLLDDDILTPESTYTFQKTSNPASNSIGLTGDLNKGLERVAQSLDGLNVNPNTMKANTSKGHQWKAQQNTTKTGGSNFQMNSVARSTLPPSAAYGISPNLMQNPGYMMQYRSPMPQNFGMQPQPMYGYPVVQYPQSPMLMQGNMLNQRPTLSQNNFTNNSPFM